MKPKKSSGSDTTALGVVQFWAEHLICRQFVLWSRGFSRTWLRNFRLKPRFRKTYLETEGHPVAETVCANSANRLSRRLLPVTGYGLLLLLSLACGLGSGPGTAIPPERPAAFEVQTATPTLDRRRVTVAPEQIEPDSGVVIPIADAPTHTPGPNPTASPTSILVATLPPEEPTVIIEPTAVVTAEIAAAPPPRPVVTPDPPLKGGSWDFEVDYIPWPNPYGEPCPGASVASGWTAFVEDGAYGSSCMNENLYGPNVFSGFKSQEITFDFIAANSGVLRNIPTRPDHRYSIEAFAKHDHSLSPVEMALGVDLTGGTAWDADTVQWFPWDNGAEDTWVATEETVTATGESMTIFIKGFHPLAEQGGKTVVDNVSVTDLGL